jgi:hypothetical protein
MLLIRALRSTRAVVYMTKPKLGSRGRKQTHIRTVGVALVVTVILISVIARISAGPASTGNASHVDSAQYGVRVAKPESMKQFPAELIPMP